MELLAIRALRLVGSAAARVLKRSRLSSSCPPGLLPLAALTLGLLVMVAGGCALFTCQPISVVVAEKQERQRVDIAPTGFRTDETGRVEEIETVRVVRTYWVRSEEGRWYSISAAEFEGTQVGQRLEVCR
jgi:hypothetical protein